MSCPTMEVSDMTYSTNHRSVAGLGLRVTMPLILTACVLGLWITPAVAAPIGWNLCGGIYSGDASDDFFLGAGARLSAGPITVNPNAEYVFVDNATSYSLNVDGHITVFPMVYAGAGLGLHMFDTDFTDSDSETVINLLAGVGLSAAPLKPYGQIKLVMGDGDDPLVFALGVRF